MHLYEQYRPATLADVVGQDKAVQRLAALAQRGLGGRALWLTGLSGTGKTTLARIVAGMVAPDLATVEVNAADVGVDDVRTWEREWHTTTLVAPHGRAYILNEAHLLRGAVVSRLLTTLEAIPRHCVVCFTTTTAGESLFGDSKLDAHPLLSRCVRIDLDTADYRLTDAFARRVRDIAVGEGLDGQPIEWYRQLATRCKWNMRAMLQAVESGGA